MNTTIESLQALYVKNGGNLTDTYSDICGGAAVGNYTTIPDMVAACAKLNIGGGGGGAEKFIVTLTQENDTWTADKTVSEIVAADAANQVVVAKGATDGTIFNLSSPSIKASSSRTVVVFGGVSVKQSGVAIEAVAISSDGSDTWMVMTQDIPTIPEYDSAQNGKVLGVSSGSLAWVDSNAPLIVTLTADGSTGNFVGDKTNEEVYSAFTAGKAVIMSANVGSATFKLAVQYASFDGTDYEFAFIDSSAVKNTVSGGANDYVTASLA